MRILHALHDYLTDQVAGVEVYTNRVARDQARRHDVGLLYACVRPGQANVAIERTVEGALSLYGVVQNRRWTRFDQTWADDSIAAGLTAVVRDFKPDLLHIQHLMNLGTALPTIARQNRVPVVMTLHDHWFACAAGDQRFRQDRSRCEELHADRCGACIAPQLGPALVLRSARQRKRNQCRSKQGVAAVALTGAPASPSALRVATTKWARRGWTSLVASAGGRRIEARWSSLRRMSREIDLFIAPSRDMRAAAIEFGLPANKILHVPHGLPIEARIGSPPASLARRFGYVGSLVPHKGVHDLLRAFDEMPTDATLDVFGALTDAPRYVEELYSLARHPGIRFHGQQDPEELPRRVAALDALVVPSIWRENAPLSILEALALGRPVVASRIGGNPEILGSLDALLFEPGSSEGLAAVLRRLAEERGFARLMAAQIPPMSSLAEHVARLESIYSRVGLDESTASSPLPA